VEKTMRRQHCRKGQDANNGGDHTCADETSVKAEAVAQLIGHHAIELLGEHPHL
jgi:hypothetical protein